jgi:hypothetical protein
MAVENSQEIIKEIQIERTQSGMYTSSSLAKMK